MEKEIKNQIEKEVAKCERRMKWSMHPQHYWMHRKAILMNCINFGFEVVLGDIEKTLEKQHQYMADVVRANQETLLDIQTKWAK